jgi:hypothetical protein
LDKKNKPADKLSAGFLFKKQEMVSSKDTVYCGECSSFGVSSKADGVFML